MNKKLKSLTNEEKRVIIDKGTEPPFTGKYNNYQEKGHYICKQCGAALYLSKDKFISQCGWPSFDDEIPGAINRTMDADGKRTEITCSNCQAHLGHVFTGESLTSKNIRHCVNSISLEFVKAEMNEASIKTENAYFAGGCFWGIEHLMKKIPGVLKVTSGYTGGHLDNPTYEAVCQQNTGHVEVVEIIFNPNVVKFKTLAKLFFEIHNPTQIDGQGPDIGNQYASVIFYNNLDQKKISEDLIETLSRYGFTMATKILPFVKFWPAEQFHQDYYEKNGGQPYCHQYTKRFPD